MKLFAAMCKEYHARHTDGKSVGSLAPVTQSNVPDFNWKSHTRHKKRT
jgi:hypothetical protein